MEALTEAQLSEAREAFSVFDKDNSGSISTSELGRIFRSLGQNASDEEIQSIIDKYDTDKSGSVEFDEFVAMMNSLMGDRDPEQDMRDTFNTFDMNGDGTISPKELHHVFKALGDDIPLEEVEKMIAEADTDHDGGVSYEEFKAMMVAK
ncbi:calmodulin 2-like protein [Meredithblackwellia eburnea MCA 4105]